jgi:hypothetical protein
MSMSAAEWLRAVAAYEVRGHAYACRTCGRGFPAYDGPVMIAHLDGHEAVERLGAWLASSSR